MDFTQKRKTQNKVFSIADLRKNGKVSNKANGTKFVHGPELFDCQVYKWSRGELLGIVADSGIGKTEFVLMCFKDILKNNPESSAIFVSLEMTTEKIANRWFEMTIDEPELAERLYVISRYDEEGKSKEVSMPWIKRELRHVQETIGDVAAFCIDHLHVLGENDVSSLNSIAIKVKEMAVETNAFGILLAQVSKTAAQKGEVPLDSDAVYGCSQFKWIATDIMQLHRPIKRYEADAGISVLGYSYTKLREPHKNDKLKVGQNKLLRYDLDSRSFIKMSVEDFTIFKLYYNQLLEARDAEQRHKAHEYDLSKEIKGKDGKVVTVTEKFSGDVDEL